MSPRPLCRHCNEEEATVRRPHSGQLLCRTCFFHLFEEEVHETIIAEKLFTPGDIVACGASGGKDSTVLMHLMKLLNERHGYGVQFLLLSIDEGITGYRDDSLKTVQRNAAQYKLPLRVLSYKELYGLTMDEVVKLSGLRNSCTFCGVFRRQALDRGAALLGATKIVTGHNADDLAETILMNVLRADLPRLSRCTSAITAGEGLIPRVKPLKYAYEKEIVLYAHLNNLDYFTTECTYSREAFRGEARMLLKEMEILQSRCIIDTVRSGERLRVNERESMPEHPQGSCDRCGYVTSQKLCRACVLLQALSGGDPMAAVRGQH
ncbi:cytoplasmic tRNA 2-thiolation protein 1 [Trypanosoma rangeli]|uniref:Cytoplasmic tRNA 2-thiolation protein 1 n=1 Tax=Trypanosoma rangeli TaxID=5698 RepID=A0A422NAA0_TRYRA|nr:cytoplasmic tRNA 2-thiolation protein 1 [Trypanosoma rangeli]RNF02385.1 cytoplasmic tRNA 2-thiolation protein 1 [Trypanosoma rangeli]|eukprot:RNF02385.1 cytoplasmic tRNA 2-thiolation protein 1 [Trypanosoma rangeli]